MQPWLARIRRIFFGVIAMLVLGAGPVAAQGIESVINPGKLIEGHAKLEDECKQCHVRFDRGAQDRLCMGCHEKVGQDVRGKAGFHGQQKPQACRACHTDHKGRTARIADFDKQRFDHAMTDFALRGKHLKTECRACHEPARKYREAPLACNVCHRKDDVHKGSLGAQCADCHTETDWKEARFDHDKTRFPLTGKHVDTRCVDCHRDKNYKEAPHTCVACHKAEDDRKGHKGQFGDRCETCHTTRSWKPGTFNHDTDTRYVLRGKHRVAQCADCHTGHLYKVKLNTDCYACHKTDDKHAGSLGKECASCHTERDWKEKAKFDHAKTSFPLLGKHVQTDCNACHKSAMFKEAPKECVACHKNDDKHEATLGDKCGDCHTEKNWKLTAGRFDHDRTKFQLRNAHAMPAVKCNACHINLRSFRKTVLDCYSCHKKDDKHEGQQGTKCETCHTDKSWRVASFDHARTRFPLTGSHLVTACKDCHTSARYKDAKSDCYSCHRKDDKHRLRLGVQCESCHSTRNWVSWTFDHNRRSNYKLEGAHAKVPCESCHTRETPPGAPVASLGSQCVACHRRDDPHDGTFGLRCEQCHVPQSWKRITNRLSAAQARRTTQ